MPRAGWKSKARCWAGYGAGRPPSGGSGGQCRRQQAAKVHGAGRVSSLMLSLAPGAGRVCDMQERVQETSARQGKGTGGRADIFHARQAGRP